MSPYIKLGVPILAFALGSWLGYDYKAAKCAVEIAEMRQAAQDQKDAEAEKIHEAATRLEAANAKARVVYRTLTKTIDRVVERPVYATDCIDDDGLRALNAALAGKALDPGQPDDAMPGAGAARSEDGKSDVPKNN